VEGKSSSADVRLLGWESPTYGDLRPAVSLIYETRSQLPVRIVTAILTDERYKLELRDQQLVVVLDGSDADKDVHQEVHQVNLSTEI
jgi:hypothetical protein